MPCGGWPGEAEHSCCATSLGGQKVRSLRLEAWWWRVAFLAAGIWQTKFPPRGPRSSVDSNVGDVASVGAPEAPATAVGIWSAKFRPPRGARNHQKTHVTKTPDLPDLRETPHSTEALPPPASRRTAW